MNAKNQYNARKTEMLHTSNRRMPHQTFKISMQYCINYSNRYMKMTGGGDVKYTHTRVRHTHSV